MPGSGLIVGDVSVNKKDRPTPSSWGAFSLMEENDIKQTHTQICVRGSKGEKCYKGKEWNPMMRGYSLCWEPEEAFLKDLKEPARGEIGAENGEEASRDREPLHSGP